MEPLKVVIHGARGKVGQVLVNNLYREPEIRVAGAVDLDVKEDSLTLPDGSTVPFSSDLKQILLTAKPDVLIDFTVARAVMPAVRTAAEHKVNLVIGTTGLTSDDLEEIDRLAGANQIGAVAAPNFALGAVLMIHLAKIASNYMDYAEIIELHHQQKADAPSGTSLATARAMAKARGRPFLSAADEGKNFASRGQQAEGVTIHSVRLPGLMAHQEVLLGGPGQTLSIRHDTTSRECYIPGVVLAVKEVVKRRGTLVFGLEALLGL